MMTPAVANVVQRAKYVIWRKMMSEPQYLDGDDIALKDECDDCGNFMFTCECEAEDPDRMHDQMHED
jgi:hypothetical protein